MTNSSVNAIKHQDGRKFVTAQISKPAYCLFLHIIICQSLAEMFIELVILCNRSVLPGTAAYIPITKRPNHSQTGGSVPDIEM